MEYSVQNETLCLTVNSKGAELWELHRCIAPWTGHLGHGHDMAARPGAVLPGEGEALSRTHRITAAL